ncbi:RIB43A-like with coiled-coils protein 2 isoform X1 [Diaphorina citri]|uniref:RIB43A-like with coiled-coils protein 2 isoform X1 n=1 Tax=Diaphorina citri TaxID=121845 RepID=A0A3Q0IX86_DIACI|nr:RIB43A-like with coiled-coils protein 2 isoform X1 [Diaphorina citri]XP_026679031.1 RIB43A-like with coiled-coils protein 2 isoform X2 [Diaphorina citri]XP_026679032.1 RIB43A-like with coiled-coils protein 2 isoform X1 [Diaphorina citri]
MNLPCERLFETIQRKESAKIERKQRLEEERKKKIFNAKNRIIGIDKEALDKQIREKREMLEEERKKEELYNKQMLEMISNANKMERKLQEERRRQEADLLKYREIYQQRKDSREFDLNDPESKKKESNLSYECNTLHSVITGKTYKDEKEERMRLQKQREEQKAWLEEQMQEKRELERQKSEAQKCYEMNLLAREKRAMELSMMEQQFKRRIEEAIRQYNLCLANEQANFRRLNKIKEKEDEKAEIYNAITGDFLTENPQLTFSSPLGPHKMIVTHFKGMTPQMKRDILETQKQQLEELQERRRQEEENNKKWDHLMIEMSRLANTEDRNLMKKKLDLAKQLREENETLATQQRYQQEYIRLLFENEARDEFFEQFGNSAR